MTIHNELKSIFERTINNLISEEIQKKNINFVTLHNKNDNKGPRRFLIQYLYSDKL